MPARVQGVQPQHEEVELGVPAVGLVLDAADVWRHDDRGPLAALAASFAPFLFHLHHVVVLLALDADTPADALGDGAGGDLGFRLADVGGADGVEREREGEREFVRFGGFC